MFFYLCREKTHYVVFETRLLRCIDTKNIHIYAPLAATLVSMYSNLKKSKTGK